AMKPQDIVPADVTVLEKLYRAANGKIAVLTLAPELENIGPVIDFCLAHHILVQAGHTNATYEEFIAGVRHGVTHATHAFNAMSPFTQRAPGAAGAVLMCPDVSCEIIADGVHVHPKIVSFLRHVKTGDNIVLVTDSLSPTAQAQGPFIANGDAVIFENGVWKRSSDRVIAGSALTMPQGIKNLVDFGYPLPQAARCASTNPARLVRLENRGQLCPGFWADITLLKTDFTPLATFIQGKQVA
ncbi:MAG: N-acetylglucosamine-6-phosphate deacetylase, partial [Elusimicrobiaceae bacterium]|nr:N-acetylglucosamine-6-phosphate deacetylase [Elusimicrobiaceae bacterium]